MISSQTPAVTLRQHHTSNSSVVPGTRKPSCRRMLSNFPPSSRCMSLPATLSTTTETIQNSAAIPASFRKSSRAVHRPPINSRSPIRLRMPRYTKPVSSHSHDMVHTYCAILPWFETEWTPRAPANEALIRTKTTTAVCHGGAMSPDDVGGFGGMSATGDDSSSKVSPSYNDEFRIQSGGTVLMAIVEDVVIVSAVRTP